MKNFTLFEDQNEFVDNLRHALREGFRSILGVASPAFGKTVVAGYITSEAKKKTGGSVWFLVHRKNLLRQTSQSFWKAGIEHGLITSGKRRSELPVQVGTIGTVHSRYASMKAPTILFIDEAHLGKGRMFETVITWAIEQGSIVIGLTGTPQRLDGKPLDIFQKMIEAKSTRWLIDQGRLSRYEIYSTPNLPDISTVRKSGGDLNREDLAAVMDTKTIVGDAIGHWRKYANGMITVCYCVNVAHSKHTAAAFNAAGIAAVHVDADTTTAELKDACEGLADGRYKILCNCELVIEGFDLSAQVGRDITLECCILLRPTESLARYLQMVFRALRKKNRPAVILDHAGCVWKHGLPDDDREWSLEGRKKGKRKKDEDEQPDLQIQQCMNCYHVFKAGPDCCPSCGEPLPRKARAEIEVVDGELEKIDVAQIRRERKREQGQARTLRELIELGLRRGMNKPSQWAAITLSARAGRKPTAKDFAEAKRVMLEIQQGGSSEEEAF
ncbi:DEAD/DEAH box helicase family protein [Herbaspirillum sp.]|jgi:superfamily II DNA or RNA helicase|uniref:DEAD/DEAH box helicase n=1 Tax=Herbaspirillum sp. TaxID=1890675 RepID=UPI000C0B36CE|nr:DEAD/DEAH box helicase family protein [Herbaspirillum sp.]MAF06156.1 hypothetical protein [Herbaspirillum sp.]|tara:strand:+ start:42091 stop:43587 length:1497 start_codon:yes stop_codon:yes gene_type:complete